MPPPVAGKLLKTAELTVDGGSKKLDTLLISTYREGSYALGVQGGRVLYLDAESLAVTRVLNVVRCVFGLILRHMCTFH